MPDQTVFNRHPRLMLLLIVMLMFAGLILGVESYARIKFRNAEIYDDFVSILRNENFPNYEQIVKDSNAFTDKLSYYDYFLWSPKPKETNTMKITHYFSSRYVPDSFPFEKADMIIWIFGGSTMMNTDTTDELSIANQLAKNLKGQGAKPTVVNFGVSSFHSSLETIKFQEMLRKVPRKEIPGIAIFYDGYNDSYLGFFYGAGKLPVTVSSKLEALITGKSGKLFLYNGSNLISQVSYFWKHHVSHRINAILFRGEGQYDDSYNLDKTVDVYEMNTRMIRSICSEFGIRPIFILQPMIFTKKHLTTFEHTVIKKVNTHLISFMTSYYGNVQERMQKYADFHDMSHILNESRRNDFYDMGHTGPYTGIIIGNEIARIVLSKQYYAGRMQTNMQNYKFSNK